MRSTLQNFRLVLIVLYVGLTGTLFLSCDDEKPQAVPTVITGTITNIKETSATAKGEITNDGTLEILASGFVYSNTNAAPTLQDNFVETTDTEDEFTSELSGLTSSTTYHIRAFASNKKGTGYGDVVDFTTGNAAPVASNVVITGGTEVNRQLTVTYAYNDSENDTESGTTFQWYVANDATGVGEAAINGATANTYIVQETEKGKYIRAGVTPKATAGNASGAEVKSAFVGAIGEATTVTFMYNGQQVTYGIIISVTGKKWLDRNLGAANAPTAYNDYANYGDLFQWGRFADGHQRVSRTGPNDADVSAVNGTTSTTAPYQTSSIDNPAHSLFIVNADIPNDWRIPQNNNLWQVVSGTNNPCPQGWRIPTAEEWAAENLGTITEAYTKLKITFTGIRAGDSGLFFQATTFGRYWTSTVDATDPTLSRRTSINTTGTTQSAIFRNNGYACRCIKN